MVYYGPKDPRRSDTFLPGIATLQLSKDPFPGTLLSFLSDFLFGVSLELPWIFLFGAAVLRVSGMC